MKKLVFAVALVMGLGTTVAFAESNLASEVVVMAQVNDFTPIEVKDLPQAVQDALASSGLLLGTTRVGLLPLFGRIRAAEASEPVLPVGNRFSLPRFYQSGDGPGRIASVVAVDR